ncbi:hypothetical protein DL766_008338 [Monosporascus sp. MC13-8B]|uniref:Uncharacterized protein n=1 Tax=Monosporascus cannonballus TaxID=155416 RepID=A0ABY0H0G2_9PEZI|nr:hypothetical protein DL762_008288 [Monosporascus cannonballus]RYO81539.1 hypothetical protein DL763_008560 [Monosporascus cannonballus]RYP19903.1 hypothetical protein DL766_008338 [Monosporascus sp. MC13-8B]
MSAEANIDGAASNLNLTPEEKRAYGQLFRQADTDNVGVVTGEVAVKFFEKTKLDSRVLGEIWQIADKENRGFLTPSGFGIVLRLIGHAQAGREPLPDLAYQPGPLPRFEGVTLNLAGNPPPPPPPPPPPAAPTSPPPLQAQATGGPIRIPALTPEKVTQYAGLFERQPLQNGNMLPGDQAKNIFEKSGLPNEVLGRIWQLADTEQRGALVQTEFVIAMHLLTSMKSGSLRALPSILPAALYEAATRRAGAAPRQSPQATGAGLSAIPRQLSGSAPIRQSSPLGRPPLGPQATGVAPQPPGLPPQSTGIAPQTTGGDWLITPADKARFDQFFADLDKMNRGFITGEEAVPFLSQSSLPEDTLAQIWDLADITSEGRLNRDTFAVAMYLIRQQRSRRDIPLPTTLPPNLIPPSFRSQVRSPLGPSPFDAPAPASAPAPVPVPAAVPAPIAAQPQPQPKSALDDLFGLDASPSPSAPAQVPLSTGGPAAKDPFAGGAPGSPVQRSPSANTFKPFVPSSSFGKSLTTHDTGGSAGSAPRPSTMDDLLADNDPEASKKITNESTELANLSNQVSSLSKQMQQVQGQRSTTQRELNQATEQKKNFEQRLAQLRSLYEKEAQEVRALEEQLRAVREETRALTGEMVTIDGSYQDVSNQHRQLSETLRADQQENANLKQRISAVNAEIAQLKPQIEKLKSDARQQKGLVAINKKQLSTIEGERDKLKAEAEDLAKSNEELSRQANTGSPVSGSAQVASPALSSSSANNPFFRRTGSADIMGAFASPPPAKPYGEKTFDDIFGSFTGAPSATPPPVTSFKQQNTGNSSASVGSYGSPSASTHTTNRKATLTPDPPAPPEPRQLNSSFLPFDETAESLSSSRQVSPPVSRAGDATASPNPPPAHLEPTATGHSVASAPDANKRSPSNETQERRPVTSNGAVPGAFPDDPSADAKPTTSFASNRDSDPFAGMKDSGNAKVDFDSAFASFANSSNQPQDQSRKNSGNAFGNFHSEFPPISELERDDDESETASEGNRFDDDFAPASPPENKVETKDTPKAPSSPATTKSTAVSDATAAEDATKQSQQSKYGFIFPDAFTPAISRQSTNLGKSDLSAFPEPPKTSPSFPKTEDSFASAPGTANNIAPANKKGAFDDLDDEFEGLEDAKEGSADDEFANISRSNLDDFNPVFDSSPPPSQPKSESTNASNTFGIDSSYDFGTVSSTPATGGANQPLTTNNTNSNPGANKGPTAPENQDWDAIFASMDTPRDAGSPSKNADEGQGSAQRPNVPGRALTEEGTHDDPFVKDLTNMGYSRADSIRALEKYDYNLERVCMIDHQYTYRQCDG